MYDLNSVIDYVRWLITVWFPAHPEPVVNAEGAYADPQFEGEKYIGPCFTPEESVERLKVAFGRSWPNGTDQPPVIDAVSMFSHFFINYHGGWDPQGNKIADTLQSQAGVEQPGTPWVIQGEPVTVMVIAGDLPSKIDALGVKVQELIDGKNR